ncbi:protein phosphatase 2C domain-containing protein [Saccharopolyspora cebuensis]|uniref:Protein phosphatase 2C domain-containing protein n=1 Tax=Saccharopolyspora cebuensis TaxID=418759 RepID=A0ABV4CTX5_9PSEU
MRVELGSWAAPGAVNEDCALAGPDWVVVLDGATEQPGVETGCAHDVPWLVRQLAAALAAGLTRSDAPLDDLLAEAIEAARRAHPECDLTNSWSPSSTASLLRRRGGSVEYLVLADSPVVLEIAGEVAVVLDDRVDRLPERTIAAVEHWRNREGGFWVAGTDPEAARHALTGAVPVAELGRAAVLSDGAARWVDRFGLGDWTALLDLLDGGGPELLRRRVRAAEDADPHRPGKRHDDLTAALVRFTG